MTRRKCGRCDWTAESDDRAELEAAAAEHVAESGHKRCCSCPRFLTDSETGACLECIARAREAFADVVELYALLPIVLRSERGAPRLGAVHGSEDETGLPGGAVLVMLAGGGDANDRDALPTDPESVSATLGQWEDTVRRLQHHPAADAPATVTGTWAYLSPRLTWIAANHTDVFPALFEDIRRLRSRILRATWQDQPVLHAPVSCFECDQARLEKTMTRDGLATLWRCGACGREYTDEAYYLAVRALREAEAEKGAPVDAYVAAAYMSSRTGRTVTPRQIRHWAERGHIAVVQPSNGRNRTLYDFADIKARADRKRPTG